MVDAADSKSAGVHALWGFESPLRHHIFMEKRRARRSRALLVVVPERGLSASGKGAHRTSVFRRTRT